MRKYTFEDFEEFLLIYTDILKAGTKSQLIGEVRECLSVMEYFEEYEKCKDLLPYVNRGKNLPTSNSGAQKKN